MEHGHERRDDTNSYDACSHGHVQRFIAVIPKAELHIHLDS
jgi:hypothetical protein